MSFKIPEIKNKPPKRSWLNPLYKNASEDVEAQLKETIGKKYQAWASEIIKEDFLPTMFATAKEHKSLVNRLIVSRHVALKNGLNRRFKEQRFNGEEEYLKKIFLKAEAKYMLKGLDEEADQEFIQNFLSWLTGHGRDQDHNKTPWGRKPVATLVPEVRKYLSDFIGIFFDSQKLLLNLVTFGPSTLNDYFVYYKYLICADDWPEKDPFYFSKILTDWSTPYLPHNRKDPFYILPNVNDPKLPPGPQPPPAGGQPAQQPAPAQPQEPPKPPPPGNPPKNAPNQGQGKAPPKEPQGPPPRRSNGVPPPFPNPDLPKPPGDEPPGSGPQPPPSGAPILIIPKSAPKFSLTSKTMGQPSSGAPPPPPGASAVPVAAVKAAPLTGAFGANPAPGPPPAGVPIAIAKKAAPKAAASIEIPKQPPPNSFGGANVTSQPMTSVKFDTGLMKGLKNTPPPPENPAQMAAVRKFIDPLYVEPPVQIEPVAPIQPPEPTLTAPASQPFNPGFPGGGGGGVQIPEIVEPQPQEQFIAPFQGEEYIEEALEPQAITELNILLNTNYKGSEVYENEMNIEYTQKDKEITFILQKINEQGGSIDKANAQNFYEIYKNTVNTQKQNLARLRQVRDQLKYVDGAYAQYINRPGVTNEEKNRLYSEYYKLGEEYKQEFDKLRVDMDGVKKELDRLHQEAIAYNLVGPDQPVYVEPVPAPQLTEYQYYEPLQPVLEPPVQQPVSAPVAAPKPVAVPPKPVAVPRQTQTAPSRQSTVAQARAKAAIASKTPPAPVPTPAVPFMASKVEASWGEPASPQIAAPQMAAPQMAAPSTLVSEAPPPPYVAPIAPTPFQPKVNPEVSIPESWGQVKPKETAAEAYFREMGITRPTVPVFEPPVSSSSGPEVNWNAPGIVPEFQSSKTKVKPLQLPRLMPVAKPEAQLEFGEVPAQEEPQILELSEEEEETSVAIPNVIRPGSGAQYVPPGDGPITTALPNEPLLPYSTDPKTIKLRDGRMLTPSQYAKLRLYYEGSTWSNRAVESINGEPVQIKKEEEPIYMEPDENDYSYVQLRPQDLDDNVMIAVKTDGELVKSSKGIGDGPDLRNEPFITAGFVKKHPELQDIWDANLRNVIFSLNGQKWQITQNDFIVIDKELADGGNKDEQYKQDLLEYLTENSLQGGENVGFRMPREMNQPHTFDIDISGIKIENVTEPQNIEEDVVVKSLTKYFTDTNQPSGAKYKIVPGSPLDREPYNKEGKITYLDFANLMYREEQAAKSSVRYFYMDVGGKYYYLTWNEAMTWMILLSKGYTESEKNAFVNRLKEKKVLEKQKNILQPKGETQKKRSVKLNVIEDVKKQRKKALAEQKTSQNPSRDFILQEKRNRSAQTRPVSIKT